MDYVNVNENNDIEIEIKVKILSKYDPCLMKVKVNDNIRHIYTNTNDSVDKSEVINSNPYITHDITLPSIQNNPNIKCQNEECNPETTDIKFIKYDEINMNYIYICNHCSSKWRNSL